MQGYDSDTERKTRASDVVIPPFRMAGPISVRAANARSWLEPKDWGKGSVRLDSGQ